MAQEIIEVHGQKFVKVADETTITGFRLDPYSEPVEETPKTTEERLSYLEAEVERMKRLLHG